MDSQSSIDAIGKFLSNLPVWLFWPVLILIVLFYFLIQGGYYFLESNNRAYLGEKRNDRARKQAKKK